MLEDDFEVVCLALFLERQDGISHVYIEEGLVDDALVEVSDGLAVVQKALLPLVVPRYDQLVARVPLLMVQLIEEAPMLNNKHFLDSLGGLLISRDALFLQFCLV